jgi:uncharacterized protein with PIN domain
MAMDSELSTGISGIVAQLAEQEQKRLRAAGTFVELEELACEIGDEVTRQLLGGELAERSNEAAEAESQSCPDCGQSSTRCEAHQRKLDSSRGELEYFEPAFQCPACRRAFFPGSGIDGVAGQSDDDSQADRKGRLGR